MEALGFVEVLFVREGKCRRRRFSTNIVKVGSGELLNVVPSRDNQAPTKWLRNRTCDSRYHVDFATLDLSSHYRKAFNEALP